MGVVGGCQIMRTQHEDDYRLQGFMGNMYLWVLRTWDREETGNVHLTEKKNDQRSKINGSSSLKDFFKAC